MDINSQVITDLITEIEKVRRRKIANHSIRDNIQYLDPLDNLNKITIPNNHLILGRRGSGKTTLLLSTIKADSNSFFLPIDSQTYRSWSAQKIITDILQRLVQQMQSSIEQSDEYKKEEVRYKKEASKWRNKIQSLFVENNDISLYEKYLSLFVSLKSIGYYLGQIKELPEEPIKIEVASTSESLNSLKIVSKDEIKASGKLKAQGKLSNGLLSLESNMELLASTSNFKEDSKSTTQKQTTNTKYEKTVVRSDLIEELIHTFSDLFSDFFNVTERKVVLYLDDFYLVNHTEQPVVIQYFHDIYKNTSNNAFCFKICSIPNRTNLNLPGRFDFSLKDDFSPIRLDKELYDFDNLKEFLLMITANLNPDLNISPQDISILFNNTAVLNYTTAATGGVPRDFLVNLAQLIRVARIDGSASIKKEHVYSVVSDLKLDKEQNIEIECDISHDKLREALEIIQTDIINKLKTNVILYPVKLVKEHEVLLKNLVNLRYLHIINESTSSEIKKGDTFVSYLVDMTFYATGKRLKAGFDFRQFWVQDDGHRHKYLRSAPVWNFDEAFITKVTAS